MTPASDALVPASAETEVPIEETPLRAGAHPQADAYALADRTAMAARRVTPDVGRHLADKLGIRAGEALRLTHVVEKEVSGR